MFEDSSVGLITKAVSISEAIVREVCGAYVRLEMEEGERTAKMAVAFPYQPAIEDKVLVIGHEDLYVIGVLRASSSRVIEVPGDLEIRAGGRLFISGAKELNLHSAKVGFVADKIETLANVTVDRLSNSYRWVKDVIQTYAGRQRTTVEGDSVLRADRITELATRDVKIDGAKIKLG